MSSDMQSVPDLKNQSKHCVGMYYNLKLSIHKTKQNHKTRTQPSNADETWRRRKNIKILKNRQAKAECSCVQARLHLWFVKLAETTQQEKKKKKQTHTKYKQ